MINGVCFQRDQYIAASYELRCSMHELIFRVTCYGYNNIVMQQATHLVVVVVFSYSSNVNETVMLKVRGHSFIFIPVIGVVSCST